AQPEPDDRGVLGGLAGLLRRGPQPQEIRQGKAGQPKRADLEKIAAAGAVAVGSRARTKQMKHGLLLSLCPRATLGPNVWVGRRCATCGERPPWKDEPPTRA